jgi:hypothetical protein
MIPQPTESTRNRQEDGATVDSVGHVAALAGVGDPSPAAETRGAEVWAATAAAAGPTRRTGNYLMFFKSRLCANICAHKIMYKIM